MLALFVIAIAAAEIGLGLAIVLLVFRTHRHVDVDRLRELADRDPVDLDKLDRAGRARSAGGHVVTVAILVVLSLAAAASFVVGHRDDRLPPMIGVAGSAVAALLALVVGAQHWGSGAEADVTGSGQIHTGGIPITVALRVDQLGASMLVLATMVALLVQIYSVAYLRGDPRYPSYTAFVSIFTAAMCLVVTADDLFVLLVGWEVMGVCSYVLISHHWELEPARSGAARAFLMTRLGDIGLLFGFFVIGSAAGTYRVSGVVQAALAGDISGRDATIGSLLMLCGVVGKSAQFPLHSWLPDAMPGPTPISALIHAATMVAAGVFLVARLLPVFELSETAMTVLAVIACVTMLGSALFALAADDLKRVLAWSTVSQLAYMFAALSLSGYAAGVLHLMAHGAFKALLFLAAGSVIHAVGTQRLDGMGGLRTAMPVTFVTMSIGFAALVGLPPLVGFFSKDDVLGRCVRAGLRRGPRPWLARPGRRTRGRRADRRLLHPRLADDVLRTAPGRPDRRRAARVRLADAGSARRAGRRLAAGRPRGALAGLPRRRARRLASRWSSWSASLWSSSGSG